MMTILPLTAQCEHCGGVSILRAQHIAGNGAIQVFDWCTACHNYARKSSMWIAKAHAGNLAEMPVLDDYSLDAPPCDVCGQHGTELHHWAPRYLFGDEAEDWPKAYLCMIHHPKWHNTVTPDMCKNGNRYD